MKISAISNINNDHVRVKTTMFGNVRALVYNYNAGSDLSFKFYTLAEVGEPWQHEAKQEAERTADMWGLSIIYGVEINQRPWVVDALI